MAEALQMRAFQWGFSFGLLCWPPPVNYLLPLDISCYGLHSQALWEFSMYESGYLFYYVFQCGLW